MHKDRDPYKVLCTKTAITWSKLRFLGWYWVIWKADREIYVLLCSKWNSDFFEGVKTACKCTSCSGQPYQGLGSTNFDHPPYCGGLLVLEMCCTLRLMLHVATHSGHYHASGIWWMSLALITKGYSGCWLWGWPGAPYIIGLMLSHQGR